MADQSRSIIIMRYLANVSTLHFFADKCTGCGRCVEVCPHGVFAMNDGDAGSLEGGASSKRKALLLDRDMCMECGACASNCAFGAIDVNSGVGCASAVINSMINGGEPSCDCSGESGTTTCC